MSEEPVFQNHELTNFDSEDSAFMLLRGLPAEEDKQTPSLRRAVATNNIHRLTKTISWRIDQGKYSDRNVTSSEDATKFEIIQALLENVYAECNEFLARKKENE